MDYSDFMTSEAVQKASAGDFLTSREKQLIGIVVAATRGCVMCSTSKMKAAAESGIPREVLIQAIDLAAQVNASVTVATALQGAQRARVDERCTSGACALPEREK